MAGLGGFARTVSAGIKKRTITQFAYFGHSKGDNVANAAGYHYPLTFMNSYQALGAFFDNPQLGNGTDPATSLTMADANDQKAAEFLSYMWYIPHKLEILSGYVLSGAYQATGDTIRSHLMGYDFTSGSSSALSNGAVIGTSADLANAGNEQAYAQSLTLDSAETTLSVGQVVMATIEQDGTNSDYGMQVIIEYKLL